ncbi:MAG: membrane protein insertion efficiency factor YidD [Candidatus Pacebacteria bacterium]|nr:membrane protein insertion efficiency factor YidD [Candidatus Paceibacterota bacterium]
MTLLKKLPNKLAIVLIFIYQKTLSPSLGVFRFIPFYPKPSCIFYPTCSQYAIECFKKYNFFLATKKTINRISRCHPGNEPKIDLS